MGKHAVVPLCEATAEMRDDVNSVALEMGNDPPDMNKALKKQKKRRERIEGLASKFDLQVKLPSKGPFGMDELVKVGAVCCDCDEEHTAFCASALKQGEEDFK